VGVPLSQALPGFLIQVTAPHLCGVPDVIGALAVLLKKQNKTKNSGSGRWCTLGRTAGRATILEWIYFQRVHFEPKAGGEVRIFGFHNKKKEKGKEKRNFEVQG